MNRYKFLNVGSVIFKVLAWAAVIVGVISAVVIFIGGGTPQAPRLTGFIGLLLGAIYFFIFYTASEVIRLLLDIVAKINKGSEA